MTKELLEKANELKNVIDELQEDVMCFKDFYEKKGACYLENDEFYIKVPAEVMQECAVLAELRMKAILKEKLEEFEKLGNETPAAEQPKFKPFLQWDNIFYGNIGEPTPLKDVLGISLRIGDTVDLFNENGRRIGERVVCKNHNKHFVHGIEMFCKNDGTIAGGFTIALNRQCEVITDGERVDFLTYVLTEPEATEVPAQEEKQPELYNGKVVCINTGNRDLFTKGRIYNFADGKVMYDDGILCCGTYRTLEQINGTFAGEFIEIVE